MEFILNQDTEMTIELLDELIKKHQGLVTSKYQELKNMYEGNHEIFNQKKKEQYKPDNRLMANFAKYIVDTFNGYFIGIPIKVSHDDTNISDYLNYLDGYNDQDDNNAELSKICSIYGHGYELIFLDEMANVGITYLTPLDGFIVYDESIRRKPLFAIRYYKNVDGELEGSYSTVDKIVYFKETDKGLSFTEEQPHYFDGVPMIEYIENEERQSIFENVKTLINAYNKAISEKANDVEYYADAYLKILGAELEEKELDTLRDKRIINLAGDDAEKIIVEFLSKPDNDTTQENLLDRLERLIFHLAMVANISDDKLGNSISGIALRYRLQAMNNLAKTKERKFISGMNRRYRLIASLPSSKIPNDEWVGIRYQFARNIPANLLEESEVAKNLAGIVSEETQLSVLSNVEDVRLEIERKNETKTDDFNRGVVNDNAEQ